LSTLNNQVSYWNTQGIHKPFSHPVNFSWLDTYLDPKSTFLDYGCGYGRVIQLLDSHCYTHLEGVDSAPQMIAQARQSLPHLSFQVIEPPMLPFSNASFDAVMLFAVLTCIPGNDAQQALIQEISRVLKSGGLLYISDLCLQTDERNQARYRAFEKCYGTYGVFETDDGAVCRHHEKQWLYSLVSSFAVIETEQIDLKTMNGHLVTATQLLVRQ
jgi:ubiquinone/menaquinone biosynthesis C-methylase UbiE